MVSKAASPTNPALQPSMSEPARSLYMASIALDDLETASNNDERLAQVQKLVQSAEYLSEPIVRDLAKRYLVHSGFKIRRSVCKLLGQAGYAEYIPILQLMEDDKAEPVAKAAEKARKRLEKTAPEVPAAVDRVLTELPGMSQETVRSIASSRSSMLSHYYNRLRSQAKCYRNRVGAAVVSAVVATAVYVVGDLVGSTAVSRFVKVGAGILGVLTSIAFSWAGVKYLHLRERIARAYHQSDAVDEAIKNLVDAETQDVQRIAANQIRVIDTYYNMMLDQAKVSFRTAWLIAVGGVVLFAVAFSRLVDFAYPQLPLIAGIASVIAEFVSAIAFVFHARTARQARLSHEYMQATQRYMLANSICEGLNRESRNAARTKLVEIIASGTTSNLHTDVEAGSTAET